MDLTGAFNNELRCHKRTLQNSEGDINSVKVFFDDRMVVKDNGSFSPNSFKGQLCVDHWLKLKLPIEVNSFSKISREALYLAHDREYVDGVLDLAIANGYGSKDADMARSLPFVVSSLVEASLHSFLTGQASVSPTGGFHHASWSSGSGFCTFNGLVVAAQMIHQLGAKRIGIADFDQHFGDGTAQIIKHLGLDYIHHYTSGAEYISAAGADHWLKELPELLHEFEGCDLVIYNAGVDSAATDPLGGYLTDAQMLKRDQLVFETMKLLGIPVAWCFAGGYGRCPAGTLSPVIERHTNTLRACLQYLPVKR